MGASFLAQNAGKRSVTVNLKHSDGKEVFRRLIATADVIVENFRPGIMERLELGYSELKEVKQDLIYCAISGFGQAGPLKDNPAYAQIVQGLSGVMSITGDTTSAPLRVGFPVAVPPLAEDPSGSRNPSIYVVVNDASLAAHQSVACCARQARSALRDSGPLQPVTFKKTNCG